MTADEKKYLPRDIRELKRLQTSLQTKADYDNMLRFSSALIAATNKYSAATNETIQIALAEQWLFRFDYHINNISMSSFLVSHYDNLAKLLVPEVVLEKVTADPYNENLMAMLCLRRTAITQAGTSTPSVETKKLLSRWLKIEVTSDELESVEKVATLLYGPAFMALYEDEANTPEELIAFLSESGLRVVKYGEPSKVVNLPSDFAA